MTTDDELHDRALLAQAWDELDACIDALNDSLGAVAGADDGRLARHYRRHFGHVLVSIHEEIQTPLVALDHTAARPGIAELVACCAGAITKQRVEV